MPVLSYITANFDRVFQVFMVFAICGWLPGISQNGLQLLILDYGAIILFALSTLTPKLREFKNYNILLILSACISTSFLNNYQAFSVDMIHVFSACMVYYCMVTRLKDPKSVIWALISIGLVNIAVSFSQRMGFDPIYIVAPGGNPCIQAEHFSAPGLMGRNYHLGYFLLPIIPLAFQEGMKLGLIFLLLSSIVIFLTGSFTLMLTLILLPIIVALIYLAGTGFKHDISKLLLCLIAIAILVGGTLLHKKVEQKISVRMSSYSYTIKEIFTNIFVGKGLGSFDRDINLNSDNPKFDSSFNQILKCCYEVGLLPIILIIGSIFTYFKRLWPFTSPALLAAVIALLIFPMFHETLRFGRLITMSVVIFGLYEIHCSNQGERNV